MEDALNSYPQYGSSMFVFTDAAPKDADDFNVQNIIDTANHWYDMKISFFLDESMCGSTTEIDKFRKVAAETGGKYMNFSIKDLNIKLSNIASYSFFAVFSYTFP